MPDRSLSLDALRSGKRLHARRYRNRRLGDFLHELGLTEGRGTGLPTIHRELKKNGSPDAYIETDPDRTYFIISIPCHRDFVTDELVVDKNGNVLGKDWVTKLGQSWVSEDDAAKAIKAINKQYHTELTVSKAASKAASTAASKAASITASKAASTAASIIRLLDALLFNDFSTRQLFLKASIPYNDTSRKKYVNFLVELGLIAWDPKLSKRSPNQTLHLTDLGKAVLQRIKK